MKTGCVRKSDFGSNIRIDASYHMSGGIEAARRVKNSPYQLITIGECAEKVFHAERWRRVYVSNPNNGIPLIGSSAMLQAELEHEKLVSRKYTDNIEGKKLKKGWILISCSGTIGNTVFTTRQHAEKLASQHVIRLVPNNILRAGYVYAYLSTKEGYDLLTQGTMGSVIQHIEPMHVKVLPIPVMPDSFQQEVDDLIQSSARLREEAAEALEEAHTLIYKHLNSHIKEKKSSSIKVKSIKESINHRFDSFYHISLGSDLYTYILSHFDWKPLGELSEKIFRPDIFKRVYVKDGYHFLSSSDIMKAIPNGGKYLSKKKTSNIPDLLIEEGWILIPRSGTIGQVVFASKAHAQKLVSKHVIRLVPNDILRGGYIFAFLSTEIGKSLIQRNIFGSVIQHIEAPHLATIPIPILDDKAMQQIDSLARLYNRNFALAIEKEEKAISMVEQEIEKWNDA